MSSASTREGPGRVVWIDGALRRGAEASLSVFDRGARDGEGLFETLRLYDRRPFLWERHLERMVVSAAELGFPVPESPRRLGRAVDELIDATGLDSGVVRVTVTRGVPSSGLGRRTRSSAWVEIEPLEARLWKGVRSGAARLVVSRRPFHPGPLGQHKTTSRLPYHLAREEARAASADEALLAGPGGEVLEGAVSNVFAVLDGNPPRVVTPPLALGILPGITRRVAIELCGGLGLTVQEIRIDVGDLLSAREIFLTNSVQEIVPVATLGDHVVPERELSLRLLSLYRERVAWATEAPAVNRPARGN